MIDNHLTVSPRTNKWSVPKRNRPPWLLFFFSLLPLLAVPETALAGKYRQPAYISNAYFSDKMAEQGGETIQPMAVVKALRTRPTGVVGYFILDLILAHKGTHHLKVNIINQDGDKITDLVYAPVASPKDETLPLYTAAGAISGDFSPGLWFFKVYDRVDRGNWQPLGAFSIMLLGPDQIGQGPDVEAQRKERDEIAEVLKKSLAGEPPDEPLPALQPPPAKKTAHPTRTAPKQKTAVKPLPKNRAKARMKTTHSKPKKAKKSKKSKKTTKAKKTRGKVKTTSVKADTRPQIPPPTPAAVPTKSDETEKPVPEKPALSKRPSRRFAVPLED